MISLLDTGVVGVEVQMDNFVALLRVGHRRSLFFEKFHRVAEQHARSIVSWQSHDENRCSPIVPARRTYCPCVQKAHRGAKGTRTIS